MTCIKISHKQYYFLTNKGFWKKIKRLITIFLNKSRNPDLDLNKLFGKLWYIIIIERWQEFNRIIRFVLAQPANVRDEDNSINKSRNQFLP